MVQRLSDIGEFGLIARIERQVARVGGSRASNSVALGIGDDAALLRLRPGEEIAVSTDASVEGVHFRWRSDAPRSLGRRMLAAALSDLAAMGARPLGCTLALAAPPRLEVRRLDAVLGGLVAEAAQRGCPLTGGNVARARDTSFNLTVIGATLRGRSLRRGRARSGDALCVTGLLGRAALARARAAAHGRLNRDVPPDRLAVGRRLAQRGIRVSCIDLSDGLAADLGHLLGGGETRGAEIDADSLPRTRGFHAACKQVGLDPAVALAAGGEDYELLFSVPRSEADPVKLSRWLGVRVAVVGRVVPQPGVRGLPGGGWRHF